MTSKNKNLLIEQQMQQVLGFQDDQEKLAFEAEMIHLNLMQEVQKLMVQQKMNKKTLAEKLGTSQGYLSQLFSGDKLMNLKLLAKLQRIFHVRFEVIPKKSVELHYPVDNVEFYDFARKKLVVREE
jgi:transcriptional regulator with XRE-family HTH domain